MKDKHAVQYKSSGRDVKLLMLLYVVDKWDNREGAINWFTDQQLSAVLDQIAYTHRDPLTNMCSTDSAVPGNCGSTALFSVADTPSIHLSYTNGVLKASLIVSPTTDNKLSVQANGAFAVGSSSAGSGGKIYLTGASFESGTNQYINTALAGIAPSVWHRGLGFLLYNFNDSSDVNNEYTISSTGGITITIPGFDVHDGTNFFYILY